MTYTPERIQELRNEFRTGLGNLGILSIYEIRKAAKEALTNLFDDSLSEIERLTARLVEAEKRIFDMENAALEYTDDGITGFEAWREITKPMEVQTNG